MADNGGAHRRTGRRWLWICAGIAAAGAVASVVGIWHLPDRMYPGTSDGAIQARAALQGGLLTAAAALTAVAGGLIALDETRRANANTHVRELYATAIGQLGADSLDVRLGGIYALERIAVDSAADQRTVVEVLSAFVREHTRPVADSDAPARLATDVQAALTVLGRLPTRPRIPRADLTSANLTSARLHGANLTGAWLGAATLTGADLRRATLTGAQLDAANLTDAQLERANLTDARLHGANLTGVQLGAATLTGAQLDAANLTDAQLERANLTDARLGAATLTSADLRRANLTGAWLAGANLTGARLAEVTLTGAGLDAANLTGAGLDTANLTGAWLAGANLTGAQLDAANLTGAIALGREQVEAARGDGRTRLPAGLVRPASWTAEGSGGS